MKLFPFAFNFSNHLLTSSRYRVLAAHGMGSAQGPKAMRLTKQATKCSTSVQYNAFVISAGEAGSGRLRTERQAQNKYYINRPPKEIVCVCECVCAGKLGKGNMAVITENGIEWVKLAETIE